MPGILSEVTNEVYNSNDYVMKVWDSIASEMTGRTVAQSNLQSKRVDAVKRAQAEAEQASIGYVQQIKAAWGDLIHTASTVPAVIEQTDETIRNDDNLQKTLAGDLVRSAVNGEITIAKEELPIQEETQRMASACSNKGSDPVLVSNVIKSCNTATASGVIGTFRSGINQLKPTSASTMASTDCTKEVATAMVKEAGKDFAKECFLLTSFGLLTPSIFSAEFDNLMATTGTALGNYLGGVLGGLPNGNLCASQTLTNFSAKCALAANLASTAFKFAQFGGQIANNMINMASSFVIAAPDLLIHGAETLAQTAINTAFLAVRTAAKQNCLIRMTLDAADNVLGLADTVIEGGVAMINTAQEIKSSVDTLIKTAQNVDIVGRTKSLIQNHPAVRSIDNLLKSNCVDIRTYMRLTQTGIKFARISLGADRQNKLSSVTYYHNKSIRDSWTREYIRRQNWTTDNYVNRYNAYGMLSFTYN